MLQKDPGKKVQLGAAPFTASIQDTTTNQRLTVISSKIKESLTHLERRGGTFRNCSWKDPAGNPTTKSNGIKESKISVVDSSHQQNS